MKEFAPSAESLAKKAAFEAEGEQIEKFLDDVRHDRVDENSLPSALRGPDPIKEAADKSDALKPDAKSGTPEAKQEEKKVAEVAEQAKPGEKPPSKYEQAKIKSEAREAKAWQKIQAENEKLAQREARVAAQEQAEAKKAEKPQASVKQLEDHAKKYEDIADRLELNGDFDKADVARNTAATARVIASERKQELAEQEAKQGKSQFWTETAFKAKQSEAFEKTKKEFPEMAYAASPLAQTVRSMMKDDPGVQELIDASPSAIYYATKHAHTAAIASRVPELEKQVQSLTAKIRELELKSTPINGDSVNEQTRVKSWNEMSTREMEAEIETAIGMR